MFQFTSFGAEKSSSMVHAKHAWLNFNYVPGETNSHVFLVESSRKSSLLTKIIGTQSVHVVVQ